ncbi:MAG: hypothetical protein EXR72_06650 [Myxococcales bacterium]|nr:hypothetical protein [Myxococcales bacterium]
MSFTRFLALGLLVSGCTRARDDGKPAIQWRDLAAPYDGGQGSGDMTITNIDPGGPGDECTERAKLVYVVDQNNVLSSFRPDTVKFTDIGTLKCPSEQGATPFSMAVDRSATAWVLYSSGELFKVDTTTAGCKATAFAPGQQGFEQFGMGFVTDAADSETESLFIASGPGFGTAGLARLDAKTLKVAKVSDLTGSPELTGTGDAKLWGFFPDDLKPRVAQLNKTTGAEGKTYALQKISGQPSAWAFAFWGGDFWIFLQRIGDQSTQVHHLAANGTLTTPLPNTGRVIVGAGVSTCAPVTIM